MGSKSFGNILDLACGDLLDIPQTPRVMTVPGIIFDADGDGVSDGDSDAISHGENQTSNAMTPFFLLTAIFVIYGVNNILRNSYSTIRSTC
uniref:Putative alpha,alpha-trehalose-phosphate synthase [UDP-forming] 10 n=1 Tax=Noccaea caerulescens TaxID=107243 RepID=A0A1J3FGY9_NOCCA